MKVYLVQHGEAKSEQEDPERPLTEKGKKDVGKVTNLLIKLNVKVSRILHGGKKRALETAQILAKSLMPLEVVKADGLEPLADSSLWAERLAGEWEDLMLVGHMPHLSRLASRLLCGDEGVQLGFKPGSVACLEKEESGIWKLRWMVTPDIK